MRGSKEYLLVCQVQRISEWLVIAEEPCSVAFGPESGIKVPNLLSRFAVSYVYIIAIRYCFRPLRMLQAFFTDSPANQYTCSFILSNDLRFDSKLDGSDE